MGGEGGIGHWVDIKLSTKNQLHVRINHFTLTITHAHARKGGWGPDSLENSNNLNLHIKVTKNRFRTTPANKIREKIWISA